MRGVVGSGPLDAAPAVGARVELRGADFALLTETLTDERGVFSMFTQRQIFVHVVVDAGDSSIPVAFAGETGSAEVFEVPEGQLWAFPASEDARWREDFAGCADSTEEGAVLGEVRLDLGGVGEENPIEQFSFVRVVLEDGSEKQACYLDAEGVYDAEAGATGITGRFAVFGLQGGPMDLVVARPSDGGSLLSVTRIFVPDGGAVVRIPAFVPL